MNTSLTETELDREQALALIEADAVEYPKVLGRLVSDQRLHVRRNAALVLSLAPPLSMFRVGQLEILARDEDPLVRGRCMTAIARSEAPLRFAMPRLLRGLADGEPAVHEASLAGVLARLKADPAAARWLIDALADPEPMTRIAAGDALQKAGKVALEGLLAALDSPRRTLRSQVQRLIRMIGKPAVPALVAALEDEGRQHAAMLTLAEMVDEGMSHADTLRKMRRTSPTVRACVDHVLASWDKAVKARQNRPVKMDHPGFYAQVLEKTTIEQLTAERNAMELLGNLRDGRGVVRANTLRMIAMAGVPDGQVPAVLDTVKPMLRDAEPPVRTAAIEVWSALKGPISSLLHAAADKDEQVAKAAQAALSAAATERLGEVLDTLSRRHSADEYGAIIDALVASGAGIHKTLARELKGHDSPMVREVCARVLGQSGSSSAGVVKALLAALSDEHPAVRYRGVWALDQLDVTDPAALAELDRLRQPGDEARHVQRAAFKAFKRLTELAAEQKRAAEPEPDPALEAAPLEAEKAAEAVSKLTEEQRLRMLGDGRAVVRANTAIGMRLKGPEDPGAEAMLRLLKDPDEAVRVAAAQAIASNKLAPKLAIPALLEAVVGATPSLSEAIAAAIAAYGAEAHAALLETLEEPTYQVMRTTGRVAPQMDQGFASTLGRSVDGEHPTSVQRNAATVLGVMPPAVAQVALKALLSALDSGTPSVKLQAIDAVARVAPPDAATEAKLRAAMQGERRASIHHAVDRALRVLAHRAGG